MDKWLRHKLETEPDVDIEIGCWYCVNEPMQGGKLCPACQGTLDSKMALKNTPTEKDK